MDSINARFTFFDIFFVILAGLPLLVDKKWLYQLFGGIIFVDQSVCMFYGVLVDIKDRQQIQLQLRWTDGMGYVLRLISLCSGLMMTGIININQKNSSITTIQCIRL
ncbi:hypothetical protein [Chryseobacterium sp. JM1]|uniref:hypothetical protein n=1 Tax=Chryseobacterium sp. JM1 TaxID=1233950 RepID=UPI0004E6F152|nr:hypothetical protein [Chryseobacterium sp. JM1]KFF20476.1 hypothetical protein IW22_12580 [Chryseobacterium sp. JM1]